jgi:hypothetical protein
MSNGLRETLKTAWGEYETAWQSTRNVEPDMVDIFESRIRVWHEQEIAALKTEIAHLREIVEEEAGFDCDRASPASFGALRVDPKPDCSCGPCRARRVLSGVAKKEKP